MRIWRCQKTPVEKKQAPLIESSNLCQEITQPVTAHDTQIDITYQRLVSEPGWLIGVMWPKNPKPSSSDELVEWLFDEIGGRYEVVRFYQFSFYDSFELKLSNDEDMALFKLKFSEYFDLLT